LARHGSALVRPENGGNRAGREHLNLRNSAYREDPNPIELDCPCTTCQTYSRAYLHHLLKAQELLGLTLITIHNVTFMNRLLTAIRGAISQGTLAQERKRWLA
jgi:queuine tRNA-ribosyltransferase